MTPTAPAHRLRLEFDWHRADYGPALSAELDRLAAVGRPVPPANGPRTLAIWYYAASNDPMASPDPAPLLRALAAEGVLSSDAETQITSLHLHRDSTPWRRHPRHVVVDVRP